MRTKTLVLCSCLRQKKRKDDLDREVEEEEQVIVDEEVIETGESERYSGVEDDETEDEDTILYRLPTAAELHLKNNARLVSATSMNDLIESLID